MKRLFSTLITVSLLASSLTALSAAAAERYLLDGRIYEKFDTYNEYYDVTMYKTVEPNENGVYAFYQEGGTPDFVSYSCASLEFDTYEFLTEEEIDNLTNYLSENHPSFTLREELIDEYVDDVYYVIDYGTELSLDEQLAIAIEIEENLGINYYGIICDVIHQLAFTRLGDLDSDGAVNALDASNILTYYSDSQTGNTDIYTDEDIANISLLGDYDADGAVNALDASLVLKEYAETQTE